MSLFPARQIPFCGGARRLPRIPGNRPSADKHLTCARPSGLRHGPGRSHATYHGEIRMTKAELVAKIKEKAQLPTIVMAEGALDAVVASLREALAAGESVTFTGFGSFKVVERAARKGRNPRTGKEITIPASKVVKFTPGKGLKDAIM
ncbi:MAG: HU family DNA-binding protein [Desulfovibrionaceae bacterium]|nr:HU family DNA-binding protein [Desulfovibrionaceae bacterium]